MPSNAKILIVDDSQICRDLFSKVVRTADMDAVTAVDGEAGLALLNEATVDGVMLDYEMPKMNGLELLRAIRATEKLKNLPVFMMTTVVSKELIVEAARLGLSGYMIKSRLSAPDLIARLKQAVSKAVTTKSAPPSVESLSVPTFVKRDATLEAVSQLGDAKSLPGVVAQIMSVSESPKASIAEIANIVKQDPVLCARLTQLACSPAYGGTKVRIGAVEDAVRTVGMTVVREMAASLAVMKVFTSERADGIDLLRCWQHALAVADIMRRIVPKTDQMPSGLPYLIGLCHDLGELLLRQKFACEFNAAVDFAKQAELRITDLIRQVFGISYAELSEALFDRLKLPPTIGAPIKDYEFASHALAEGHANPVSRSLAIANFLANGMQCASTANSLVAPIQINDCRIALIPPNAINIAEIRSETLTSTCMLAQVNASQEASLMKPLLPKADARVWYARNAAFAPLDPLEAALQGLCSVDTRDQIPTPEQLQGIQGVIIVSPKGGLPPEAARLAGLGGRVPVLHLTRPDSMTGGTLPAGFEEMSYPVSLHQLAKFINALPAAAAAPAAAPTATPATPGRAA